MTAVAEAAPELEIGGGTGEDHDFRFSWRSKSQGTLAALREAMDDGSVAKSAISSEISLHLVDEGAPIVRVKGKDYPATMNGFLKLAGSVSVPEPFARSLWDQYPDLGQTIVNELLYRDPEVLEVRVHDDRGVTAVRPQNILWVEPIQVINHLAGILTPEAEVANFDASKGLRLDVVAPLDIPHFTGGDRAVGDITGAGVRIDQKKSSSQFHSPSVSLYLHRLICTNGMTVKSDIDRVDARSVETVDEWLLEFDALVNETMRRAQHSIDAFYALRDGRVADPRAWLTRVGKEHDFPRRVMDMLYAMLTEWTAEDGSASEFDLVNIITHAANAPDVLRAGRDRLQGAGGILVAEHHRRCGSCQSRLD